MEDSSFKDVLSTNDISIINNYLQKNLPTLDELELRTSDQNTNIFLDNYNYLYNSELNDYLPGYEDRGITNLMVISSRNYLPLLLLKSDSLSNELINQRNVEGMTALDYAKEPEIRSLLENQGNLLIYNREHLEEPILVYDQTLPEQKLTAYGEKYIVSKQLVKNEYIKWWDISDPRIVIIPYFNPVDLNIISNYINNNFPIDESKELEYAVYDINARLKPLFILKPRQQKITYTPFGVQRTNQLGKNLRDYDIMSWISVNKDSWVPIKFVPGRDQSEIDKLINLELEKRKPVYIKDIIQVGQNVKPFVGEIGLKFDILDKYITKLPKNCPNKSKEFITINFSKKDSYLSAIHNTKNLYLMDLEQTDVIMGKNFQYYIETDNPYINIYRDIVNCQSNLITYYIFSQNLEEQVLQRKAGHAMAILIDRMNHIVEVFDPSGITQDTKHIYWWSKILVRYLQYKTGDDWKRVISSDDIFCPQIWSHMMASHSQIMQKQGQCSLWTFYYLWLRISNPDVDREKILKYMSKMESQDMNNKIFSIATLLYQ